jgi:hypothetical protein
MLVNLTTLLLLLLYDLLLQCLPLRVLHVSQAPSRPYC